MINKGYGEILLDELMRLGECKFGYEKGGE
jgi:hypothetical protein